MIIKRTLDIAYRLYYLLVPTNVYKYTMTIIVSEFRRENNTAFSISIGSALCKDL